ncbi:uncharacterized protein [Typha angustifolia]|uniref:uncharacterized protein n=1 Tax=Typha angustifolia TaxID=59011 RepID=UPI003C2F81BF
MAVYQIFVKLLDGKTHCLQIPSPTVSGETLKLALAARTRIPFQSLRLVSGRRDICDETLIHASSDDRLFPSCSLLLRLRGGKGGFGSLLRGAATKAGQKKTNNFDACRDMSGRRLRHVNAEKRLEEWKAEAEDRQLEKLAQQFLKKKAKEVKKSSSSGVDKYLEKYKQDAERCVGEVEESVRQSFELYKDSKRKILPGSGKSSKRLKIWLGKKKVEESDSDEDDDDNEENDGGDEKSVVLDEANCSNGLHKIEEGSSDLGSASDSRSDGESSGAVSERSNLEETNETCVVQSLSEGSGSGDNNPESDASVEVETHSPEEVGAQNSLVPSLEGVPESNNVESEIESVIPTELLDKKHEVGTAEEVVEDISLSSLEEPFSLDKYNSSTELEVLGLERLKEELQAHGLKCGGTLQERASRLFLLKTTPLEKLPKKVLARPASGGK